MGSVYLGNWHIRQAVQECLLRRMITTNVCLKVHLNYLYNLLDVSNIPRSEGFYKLEGYFLCINYKALTRFRACIQNDWAYEKNKCSSFNSASFSSYLNDTLETREVSCVLCSCQNNEVPRGQEEVQGDSAAIWRERCNWTVLSRALGHAVSHQESPDEVSLAWPLHTPKQTK